MDPIEVRDVRIGTTGAGGWDVLVTVHVDGRAIDGEVTLLPAPDTGIPASWGERSHWLSASLIGLASDVLDEIESATREAILAKDGR